MAVIVAASLLGASVAAIYTLKKSGANPLDRPTNPLEEQHGSAAPLGQPIPSGGVAPAARSSSKRFVSYVVKDDPSYIGGEVSRLLIPAGWKVDGGIEWDLTNTNSPAQTHIAIYNPQGLEAFAAYPDMYYYWSTDPWVPQMPVGSNYDGAIVQQPMDDVFAAMTQLFIPRYRKDLQSARIIEREELPKLAAMSVQNAPQLPGIQNFAKAGRMRFEYQVNGQTVQEDVCAVLNTGVCAQMQITIWSLAQIVSTRAAKGKLDEAKMIRAVVDRSIQPNIQWLNKYIQFSQARHNVAMDAIRQAGVRSQIIAQLSNDISDITRSTFEQQQRVNDELAEARDEEIRDITPYEAPDGKRVTLPSEYQFAWGSADGQYIVSNDPNFDPNTQANTGSNWKKMRQAAR